MIHPVPNDVGEVTSPLSLSTSLPINLCVSLPFVYVLNFCPELRNRQ